MMTVDPTIAIVFGSLLLALFSSLLFAYWQQTFKYRTSKRRSEGSTETLKLSELEELIRKAVAEATHQLDDRMAEMEIEVQSLRTALGDEAAKGLPEAHRKPQIRIPKEEEEELSPILSKKRVR